MFMLTSFEKTLLERFSGSAPRYTSYPTAPHFRGDVGPETLENWLRRDVKSSPWLDFSEVDPKAVSLYAHVPFCGTLCWFCACRSAGVRRYAPVERYLESLKAEAEKVGPMVAGATVRHIHWGGGSPTILVPRDIVGLANCLRSSFDVASDAEFAVEIDPRDMTEERLDALAEAGVTRASLGVQDFDPIVQAAINREQSFETTQAIVEGLRRRGVPSINLDALYGLPHQTTARLERTISQLLELSPDRVALFGYAHVPWMAKRQKLIPMEVLPNSEERFEQARLAADMICDAGYVRVGLDHFAKPGDALAEAEETGALRRNFQGYTVDPAPTLVGLGASAISRTPFGYAQNETATADYQNKLSDGVLATTRGVRFSADDAIRGYAIERLMCGMEFDKAALRKRFGDLAVPVIAAAERRLKDLPEGLIELTRNGFHVTEAGRPFLRNIAGAFDAYLDAPAARYSRAI